MQFIVAIYIIELSLGKVGSLQGVGVQTYWIKSLVFCKTSSFFIWKFFF